MRAHRRDVHGRRLEQVRPVVLVAEQHGVDALVDEDLEVAAHVVDRALDACLRVVQRRARERRHVGHRDHGERRGEDASEAVAHRRPTVDAYVAFGRVRARLSGWLDPLRVVAGAPSPRRRRRASCRAGRAGWRDAARRGRGGPPRAASGSACPSRAPSRCPRSGRWCRARRTRAGIPSRTWSASARRSGRR